MNTEDRKTSPQEHAEVIRRMAEIESQKKAGAVSTLEELIQELGISGDKK